jgi:hypothetical protein
MRVDKEKSSDAIVNGRSVSFQELVAFAKSENAIREATLVDNKVILELNAERSNIVRSTLEKHQALLYLAAMMRARQAPSAS